MDLETAIPFNIFMYFYLSTISPGGNLNVPRGSLAEADKCHVAFGWDSFKNRGASKERGTQYRSTQISITAGGMAPRNDPGKNDDSPSQLREAFRRANALNEDATEADSSTDEDDDVERDPEASGYAPIPMTPPPSQREEAEVELEENFADFDAVLSSGMELRQEVQSAEARVNMELSPRVRSMAQADQREHRREEARERASVFRGARSSGSPRVSSMEMDAAKLESIRNAMAGILLPESAVPNWAKEMSDTEWQEMVHKKLNKPQ